MEYLKNEKIQKKRNVCKTIDEATTKTLPEYDILIASLLENLFPNSNNVSQYSIAMAGEYYKYFAGRCAKTEMTGAEVHNVISLAHDEFDRKIRDIIKHEKYEHFKIKLSKISNSFFNKSVKMLTPFKNGRWFSEKIANLGFTLFSFKNSNKSSINSSSKQLLFFVKFR